MKKRIKISKSKRLFINIYYEDGCTGERTKKDITLSFSDNDPLYQTFKKLGSTNIKKVAGLSSFKEIKAGASKEGRSIGNYVKNRLRRILK